MTTWGQALVATGGELPPGDQDREEQLVGYIQTGRMLLQYYVGLLENGAGRNTAGDYLQATREWLADTREVAP